jgi:hypothetical protein
MSLHAIRQAMVDGADLEIDAFQAPKCPLHLAEALVGTDGKALRGSLPDRALARDCGRRSDARPGNPDG